MKLIDPDERLYELVELLTDRLPHATEAELQVVLEAEPGLAEQLGDLLPVMQVLAGLGSSLSPPGGTPPAPNALDPSTPASLPERRLPEVHEWFAQQGLQIIREIGCGGMGIVYEAQDLALSRRVAVKMLPPYFLGEEIRRTRFRHEALAAARLQHPHIVNIYSVHCTETLHYYVMRYIRGHDLSQLLKREHNAGSPPTACSLSRVIDQWCRPGAKGEFNSNAVDVRLRGRKNEDNSTRRDSGTHRQGLARSRFVAHLGRQAAAALAYAHAAGVIHRDIKPSNLLLESNGHLWITDFGLAQVEQLTGLTHTGDVLGTLRYMSPEQLSGDREFLDHRTDIYSLGMTLIEVLVGNPSRKQTGTSDIGHSFVVDRALLAPGGLRRILPGLPVDLETILLKCASVLPAERYANAMLLADDLQAFLDHRPIQAKPPTWIERSAKWMRRHQSAAAAIAATLAIGLIFVVSATVLLLRERQARYYEQLLAQQQAATIDENRLVLRNHRYAVEIQLAHQAWKQLQPAVARKHLANCLPEEGQSDLRGFEWYYLQDVLESVPIPMGQHDGEAYFIDFSPNGQWMATCGSDGVRIFETERWRQVTHLQGHASDVNACKFGASNQFLVTAGDDGRAIVWSTGDWQMYRTVELQQPVVFACLSSDETSVIACQRESPALAVEPSLVTRSHLDSGELEWQTGLLGGAVHGATYVEGEEAIAAVSDSGMLFMVDCNDGSVVKENLGTPLYSISAIAENRQLAIGDRDGNVRFVLADFQQSGRKQVTCATNSLESLMYDPHRRQVVHASRDGTVGIWTVDLSSPYKPLTKVCSLRHRAPLWCARLHPTRDQLVTVDRSGAVTRWDLQLPNAQLPEQLVLHESMQDNPAELYRVASGSQLLDASPDGKFVAGTAFGSALRIWEAETGKLLHQLNSNDLRTIFPDANEPSAGPYTVRFVPRCGLLGIAFGTHTLLFDPRTATRARYLDTDGILDTATPIWHSAGRLYATGAFDQEFEVWDAATSKRVFECGKGVAGACWSPDGEHLLIGYAAGYATIHRIPVNLTGSAEWPELTRFSAIGSLAYSADGKTICDARTDRVRLLNAVTQRLLLEFSFPAFDVWYSPRFSSDGRRLTLEGPMRHGTFRQHVWSLSAD